MAFKPKILGFLCNWCSYIAADPAGKAKLPYSDSVHVIRVMCSCRVDPSFVLKAFARGFDGVLICGCHPGDCHYVDGNLKGLARYHLSKNILTSFGIEPDRVRLAWASASEGALYAKIVNEMCATVEALGPMRPMGLKELIEAE